MSPKSNYPGIKAAIVVMVALLLLVPVFILQQLVSERQNLAQGVEQEIAAAAGGELALAGPVLVVPADLKTKDGWQARKLLLLPDSLSVVGNAKTELRTRGIYSTPVFESVFDLEAAFTVDPKKILDSLEEKGVELRLSDARIAIELQDTRALREKAVAEFGDGTKAALVGGMPLFGAGYRSLSAPAKLVPGTFSVKTRLKLGGGGSMRFVPLAQSASFKLAADWPAPSFTGTPGPSFRDLHDQGFSAEWNLADGNGGFPQVMQAQTPSDPGKDRYVYADREFGVGLFKSVSLYHKSDRALKYALLFLIVPFLVVYLMELFVRVRIHPIQYALIGLADVVFYALLLSISERLPFAAAYWISAGAVGVLIALYASASLGSFKRGLSLLPVLGVLYLYLYSALLSEDYALLIGSIGVFAVLAAVMYATRRIDWYALGKRDE